MVTKETLSFIKGDIDHFERQKDFTYDKIRFKDFPDYVNELKSRGIRFIPILDPALVTNENDYMPYIRVIINYILKILIK